MGNGKITPLYERLSRNDELQGKSNSISQCGLPACAGEGMPHVGKENRQDYLPGDDPF